LVGALIATTAAFGASAPASYATATSPPFTECPAIGAAPTCGLLIHITTSGTTITADPARGPYDGGDDSLLGVKNDSAASVSSIALSSTTLPVFGFEGDGLCTFPFAGNAGCPFDPTGYGGPGVSFGNISASQMSGLVKFSPAIPPGGTAYFSLEDAVTPATITVGPSADLSLTKSSSPNPAIAGQQLTYTLTATNHGPDTAMSAVITDTLPAGETLATEGVVELVGNTIGGGIDIVGNVAAFPFPGAGQAKCTSAVSGGVTTVTCPVGNIASGASKTVTILVVPSTGSPVNHASVSSATADPNLANNSASNTTTVTSNCTVNKTGYLGSLIVRAPDFLCVNNANVGGAIIVHAGAALTVTNSTTAGIGADTPVFVTVCNSTVNGSINVQNASQLVRIGDSPFACAPNHISGSVTLSGNHGGDGGPAIVGNTGSGSLDCKSNSPVATDRGVTNTISGSKLNECAGAAF